jgi:plastocyanin
MPGIKRFITGVAVLGIGAVMALPASTVAHAATTASSAAAGTSSTTTSPWNHRTAARSGTATAVGTMKTAAGAALTLSVDAQAPPGKNWEYTHFFPESGVTLPTSSVVDFKFNPGDPNGFHTVTFNLDEAAYRAAHPDFVADNGAGENAGANEANPIFPADVNNQQGGTAGCGFSATPCIYDGAPASTISSGAVPTPLGLDFLVQLPPTAGTWTYFCLIHPHMSGTITTVTSGPTTSQGAADGEAGVEYGTLNSGAFAAEAAANHPSSVTNPDGTKTWNVQVGGSADDVELLEMLPLNLSIAKGDTVKYTTTTQNELHTVSFANSPGGFALAPFLPPECEGTPTPASADTPPGAPPAGRPPQFGCADPSGYEQPFQFGPQPPPGVHTILSGATSASSGVLTSGGPQPPGGIPNTYSYNFPHNGTFFYFCFFHQGMFGVVNTPGYRLVGKDGGVFDFGGMDFFGSKGGSGINNVVAIVNTNDGQGYWIVGSNGAVYNFGDAPNFGDFTKFHLNAPIVGAAATADGGGLYLVGGDGGIFTLGDAVFQGSTGSLKLNKPVVGLAVSPDGSGYWLVAADGGVFTFGVPFFGSTGSLKLNKPVIGMLAVPDFTTQGPKGYYLFASDGGVFTFNVPFLGSLGSFKLNAPIVGLSLTVDFSGYRLVGTDGGVFDFNAPFFGSLGSFHLNSPINGIAGT